MRVLKVIKKHSKFMPKPLEVFVASKHLYLEFTAHGPFGHVFAAVNTYGR